MTPKPGIEPGPHWWEASALTTAPSLLPPQNDSVDKERGNYVISSVLPTMILDFSKALEPVQNLVKNNEALQ